MKQSAPEFSKERSENFNPNSNPNLSLEISKPETVSHSVFEAVILGRIIKNNHFLIQQLKHPAY